MTDLDALIRQAELQQKQMQLELQFQKNMALFKQYAKPIYDEYFNYQPQLLRLQYDAQGFINLVNTGTGAPVYKKDPEQFCQQQFDDYCKLPLHFKIGYRQPEETYFFQLPMISRLLETVGDTIAQRLPSLDKPVGLMLMNGCGLGYHIPKLLERADIYTLCIFDPYKDSFYASLHTTDWEPILQYFRRPGRMLKLYIGNTTEKTITGLRLLTNKIGLHNISNTYIYNHLNSEKTNEFFNQLKHQFHLTLTGTGFLEDEQVSVAHTVDNINHGIPVLNNTSLTQAPPAIVVGNGPSLDGLLEKLRELKDKAIIFSCGSTTGTLYKHGITPDFHVEMERIGGTARRIANGTSPEYRQNINMLALNTVAPETMALFNKRYMAKKINDPGERIIDMEYGKKMPYLNLSNPTCTNTGLSYALQLGFKQIYLFGVDLGMHDADKHHASDSQYYDETNKPLFASSEKRVNITRKGNLGGEVITTAIMDTARANIELLIGTHPNAKVYNPNDGAYIAGAETIAADDIVIDEAIEKQAVVDKLLKHCFSKPKNDGPLNDDAVKQKYLREFLEFRPQLELPENPRDATEIQQALDSILGEINKLKDVNAVAYWLTTGSVQSFFSLLLQASLGAKTDEEMLDNYHCCRAAFNQFIERAYDLINNHCLKHHDIDADFSHLRTAP